jgi:hypothetical protein
MRESNYIYSPIGVELITPLKYGWSVGATLEYDMFWGGKQISSLGGVTLNDPVAGDFTFSDIKNRQDNGYGIRGSIKVQKGLKKIDLVIEPYIRYWNIKQSNETTSSTISSNGYFIVGTFVEPRNNSTEMGCKLAVKF